MKRCHHRSPSGAYHIAAVCPLCNPPTFEPQERECPHGNVVTSLPADCDECLADFEAERREQEIERRSAAYVAEAARLNAEARQRPPTKDELLRELSKIRF